jgi:hypothetical protein
VRQVGTVGGSVSLCLCVCCSSNDFISVVEVSDKVLIGI